MDILDTLAGREFCERVMTALEDIAQSLEVVADQIINNQDKDGSNEK